MANTLSNLSNLIVVRTWFVCTACVCNSRAIPSLRHMAIWYRLHNLAHAAGPVPLDS